MQPTKPTNPTLRNYKQSGILGLEMKYSPGAPKKLSKEQEYKMVEVITNSTPDEVGFESRKNWTLYIIREWGSQVKRGIFVSV